MTWFRSRLAAASDDGFSLVEAIVALSLAAVVLSSFSFAMIGGVKASMVSRQNQQAGDLLNKTIEDTRSLAYSTVAMDPTDVVGSDGGYVVTCGAAKCLRNAQGIDEPLALAAGGSISPHITTTSLNNVPYTVMRYVTLPPDTEAGASYKRLSVFVKWSSAGNTRTREATTIIADTRRGLPLPLYKFSPVGPDTVMANPGAPVRFGFKVTNNGARDTWNISTSEPALGWTYVFDNGDNVYDAATDTVTVTDTTADGILDTGPLEPTTSTVFWVLRTVPTSPTSAYTATATFTVTSFAAPSYFSTLTTTVQVVTGVASPTPSSTPLPGPSASPPPFTCPVQSPVPTASGTGSTLTAHWLYNTATAPASTTAQSPMVMDPAAVPTATTLWNYSTDDGTTTGQIQAGRQLRPTTLGASETDPLKIAHFRYRMTANRTIGGTLTAKLWAVPQSGLSTDPMNLAFYFKTGSKSGSTYVWTERATATYSVGTWGCPSFNGFTVALPMAASVALKNNDYLDLYVVNTGTADLRLAYGTADHKATLVVPLS